jgi:hypothetical protein
VAVGGGPLGAPCRCAAGTVEKNAAIEASENRNNPGLNLMGGNYNEERRKTKERRKTEGGRRKYEELAVAFSFCTSAFRLPPSVFHARES